MLKMRFNLLAALLAAFALVSVTPPTRALASNLCVANTNTLGFSVDTLTRGSVVTLCARYRAAQTKPAEPRSKTSPINKPIKRAIKVLPPKPDLAQRLLHRRLARDSETSFSPLQLVIQAAPFSVKVNNAVSVDVRHNKQFHTAYLLNRFVSFRFIPLFIAFHFDSTTKPTKLARDGFKAKVIFKTKGLHWLRGLVTYRAEYRLNGAKSWMPIAGTQQVAAIAARVSVAAAKPDRASDPKASGKPLLVANDCPQSGVSGGCLN